MFTGLDAKNWDGKKVKGEVIHEKVNRIIFNAIFS
jgi:hypothetical protein